MPRASAGGEFLDLNGIVIADPEGRLYGAMIAVAERGLDKGGLAQVFRDLA
jgi:death-on-curing protein